MATPKFDALLVKLRSWANRDSTVLTDALLTDFLDYSADYCYRNLRIPPLEYTYTYPTITSGFVGESTLELPPDLSEVVQFRRIDSEGNSYVFSEKLGIQPIQNHLTKDKDQTYSRKGNFLVFHKEAALGDTYELHYYRRLPDLDALYTVNQANIDAGNCVSVSSGTAGSVEFPTNSGFWYLPNEVDNWLRDDNERMLLWGALSYALEYVGEDERAAKFTVKQNEAIMELNREEIRRRVSGGSLTSSYEVLESI